MFPKWRLHANFKSFHGLRSRYFYPQFIKIIPHDVYYDSFFRVKECILAGSSWCQNVSGDKKAKSFVKILPHRCHGWTCLLLKPLNVKKVIITAQKWVFFIKCLFSKCNQIRRKLQISTHLLQKRLTENFIFCRVSMVIL